MSEQIEWDGSVPEPDASISAGMARDGEATYREARLLNSVVNGIFAEHRKAHSLEDILDVRVPLERIEQRLAELLTASADRKASSIESPYLTTEEAAEYLRSTVKTIYDRVKRGKLHPVPGCRGLFTKDALDRFALTRRRRKKMRLESDRSPGTR